MTRSKIKLINPIKLAKKNKKEEIAKTCNCSVCGHEMVECFSFDNKVLYCSKCFNVVPVITGD